MLPKLEYDRAKRLTEQRLNWHAKSAGSSCPSMYNTLPLFRKGYCFWTKTSWENNKQCIFSLNIPLCNNIGVRYPLCRTLRFIFLDSELKFSPIATHSYLNLRYYKGISAQSTLIDWWTSTTVIYSNQIIFKMTTRVYLPRHDTLYQTTGIDSLVTSVAAYVQAADGSHTPNKVALMYRAFCEALIQENLLKLHQIPAIIIQYQGISYKVSIGEGTLSRQMNWLPLRRFVPGL